MSENDQYPKFACGHCVWKINIAAEFQDMSLSAYEIFDQMMESQTAQLQVSDVEDRFDNFMFYSF